jgi:hypothetical protein
MQSLQEHSAEQGKRLNVLEAVLAYRDALVLQPSMQQILGWTLFQENWIKCLVSVSLPTTPAQQQQALVGAEKPVSFQLQVHLHLSGDPGYVG